MPKGLVLHKYGEKKSIRITQVEKEDVLKLDLNAVKGLYTSATKELNETGVIQPWNLVVSGYENDLRLLVQIPEVVAWFKTVQRLFPFIPIFLSPFILEEYILSQLDNLVVTASRKTMDLSVIQKRAIDDQVAYLNAYEPLLGDEFRKRLEYSLQYRIDLNQIQYLLNNIKYAANIHLSIYEVSKPVREKAIEEALVRINSVLES
jgi:hypothetical protein